MDLKWVDGFRIRFVIGEGGAVLSANREGLLSLANHLTALSLQPGDCHIHLDACNSLEEGSAELILERCDGGDSAAGGRP